MVKTNVININININRFFLVFLGMLLIASHCFSVSYLDQESLVVSTNGLVYVGGNVGIGTANPTSKLHVVGDSLFTKPVGFELFLVTAEGNPTTIDWSNGNKQFLNWSVNAHLSLKFRGAVNGASLVLIITYSGDRTSSNTVLTWDTHDDNHSIKFPGGELPQLTRTEGAIDTVHFFYYDGVYYGVPVYDFR